MGYKTVLPCSLSVFLFEWPRILLILLPWLLPTLLRDLWAGKWTARDRVEFTAVGLAVRGFRVLPCSPLCLQAFKNVGRVAGWKWSAGYKVQLSIVE